MALRARESRVARDPAAQASLREPQVEPRERNWYFAVKNDSHSFVLDLFEDLPQGNLQRVDCLRFELRALPENNIGTQRAPLPRRLDLFIQVYVVDS